MTDEEELNTIEADLNKAIRDGDMHMALHCAAVLHHYYPSDAYDMLAEASGYAGSIAHSPHLTTTVSKPVPQLRVVN